MYEVSGWHGGRPMPLLSVHFPIFVILPDEETALMSMDCQAGNFYLKGMSMFQQQKQEHTFWRRYGISNKTRLLSILPMLLVLVAIGPVLNSQSAKAAPQASYPIKHIIIIVKENRTFDNYFGTFPGADGATTYKNKKGQIQPLNHQPDQLFFDIGHTHTDFLKGYDHGKMDGFSLIPGAEQYINGKKTDEADSQMYQSDIPNYWQYAQTFALPDHFFYNIDSNSFPNHILRYGWGSCLSRYYKRSDRAGQRSAHTANSWGYRTGTSGNLLRPSFCH